MPIPIFSSKSPSTWVACAIGLLAAWTAGAASAAPAIWQTDGSVGVSQVSYTLTFECTGPSAVCGPLNAYSDTQVSTLTGGAGLDFDADLDALQFETDGLQDVGSGPAPAYLTLLGSNLTFAGIALFGVPEVVAPVVFSTDNPVIAVTGLELPAPGSYTINTSMTWGGHGDVVGDLAGAIPEIQVTPALVPVTATLVVLGDVDLDGYVEFEIRDLQTLTMTVDQYVEGTLVIDVQVTATLLANLSGEVEAPPAPPVPVLGGAALGVLGLLMGAMGTWGAGIRSRGC